MELRRHRGEGPAPQPGTARLPPTPCGPSLLLRSLLPFLRGAPSCEPSGSLRGTEPRRGAEPGAEEETNGAEPPGSPGGAAAPHAALPRGGTGGQPGPGHARGERAELGGSGARGGSAARGRLGGASGERSGLGPCPLPPGGRGGRRRSPELARPCRGLRPAAFCRQKRENVTRPGRGAAGAEAGGPSRGACRLGKARGGRTGGRKEGKPAACLLLALRSEIDAIPAAPAAQKDGLQAQPPPFQILLRNGEVTAQSPTASLSFFYIVHLPSNLSQIH